MLSLLSFIKVCHPRVDRGQSLNVKRTKWLLSGVRDCVRNTGNPRRSPSNPFSPDSAPFFKLFMTRPAAYNWANRASLRREGQTVTLGRHIIHSNARPFFRPFPFPTLILPSPMFTSSATLWPAFKAGRD